MINNDYFYKSPIVFTFDYNFNTQQVVIKYKTIMIGLTMDYI